MPSPRSTARTDSTRRGSRALGVLALAAAAVGAPLVPACGLEVGGSAPPFDGGGLDGHGDVALGDALPGDGPGDDGGGGNDADCPRLCSQDGTRVVDCDGGTVTVCTTGTCVQGSCVVGAWSPKSLTGLVLWLRADSITGDAGASVATWADQSGQGHDALQSVAIRQPTLAAGWKNGHPAVAFANGAYLLSTATSLVSPNSAYSVLAVGQAQAPAQGSLLTIRTTAPAAASIWYAVGGTTYVHNGSQVATVAQDLSTTLEAPFWSVHRYTGGGATPRAFLDGTEETVTGSQTDESTGLAGFYVGTNAAGQAWTGDIAELVVVANALSDGDRASWDTYVKSRYAF